MLYCFPYQAWNDGTIRAFAPHNGQLHFAIHNAHTKAVSTVAVTSDGAKLISGGCDGQVRLWEIKGDASRLISILKEHRGPITSLHVARNDEDLISSSTDGTCVVWDITRCARKHILLGNTMFMMAQFTPDGIQILTCGTDRKIAYWETLDCSLVREVEGSSVGALNCLDISPDGRCFVTGSNECTVKIWKYDSADITHIGISHAAIITACKFSPDGRHIVTASADGAIMIWKYPCETSSNDSPSAADTKKVADRTDAASTHNLNEEDWRKLSLQKPENSEDITASDRIARTVGKSLPSSANDDRKKLSASSNRSRGSKKDEERTCVCKCALAKSVKPASSAGTTNPCNCINLSATDKPKVSSDTRSRRSITSST